MGCQISKTRPLSQNHLSIDSKGSSDSQAVRELGTYKSNESSISRQPNLNKTSLKGQPLLQEQESRPKTSIEANSLLQSASIISARPSLSQRSQKRNCWPAEEFSMSNDFSSKKNRSASLRNQRSRFKNWGASHSISNSKQRLIVLQNGKSINNQIVFGRNKNSSKNLKRQKTGKSSERSPLNSLPHHKLNNLDLLNPIKLRSKIRRTLSRVENPTNLMRVKGGESMRSCFDKNQIISPLLAPNDKYNSNNTIDYDSQRQIQDLQFFKQNKNSKFEWKLLKESQGKLEIKPTYHIPIVYPGRLISPSSSYNIRTGHTTKLSFSQQYSKMRVRGRHLIDREPSRRMIASPSIKRRLKIDQSEEQKRIPWQVSLNGSPHLPKIQPKKQLNNGQRTMSTHSSNRQQVNVGKRILLFEINSCSSSTSSSTSSSSETESKRLTVSSQIQ